MQQTNRAIRNEISLLRRKKLLMSKGIVERE